MAQRQHAGFLLKLSGGHAARVTANQPLHPSGRSADTHSSLSLLLRVLLAVGAKRLDCVGVITLPA